MDRRRFLAGSASLAASLASSATPTLLGQPSSSVDAHFTRIREVFFDLHRLHKWDDSNGDTWDPFWADDGNLYAFNCDGRGFGSRGMNLAFNRLAGDTPDTLAGSQVNEMDEYGKGSAKGPDNATWKACGQECIDGVFYAFVSRNTYGSDSKDPLTRQLAHNASLIKSHDRGKTWTRSAAKNYQAPMWPGARFGAPFFVHYGQNGGSVSRDQADRYVYAISTNGFWNDGDSLILGRVPRNRLSQLNSSDWQYCAARNPDAEPTWSAHIEEAVPILSRPAKCGQTPITYIPALQSYLLISWYNTERMTTWFEPNEMRYDFYQAPHPWGPWKLISSHDDRFLPPTFHMYGPSLCSRFQQSRGSDVEISLFTAGCPFEDVPSSPYKMWRIPIVLRTHEPPGTETIAASSKSVAYRGLWFPWITEPGATSDVRASDSAGSSAEITFTGTGIEYLAHKTPESGDVQIFLDGAQQETTSLRVTDFPVLFNVTMFARHGLPFGKHTLRLVHTAGGRINIASFAIQSHTDASKANHT